MDSDTTTAAERLDEAPSSRRRGSGAAPRTRRPVAAVTATALLCALGWAGWTWRHPDVFPAAGGWSIRSSTVPVGQAVYVGVTWEGPDARGTVSIDDAHAHVLADSADATFTFFVCTVDPSAGVVGVDSGDEAQVRRVCSTLEPARGAALRLNATPHQQLVMAITLRHAGTVEVDGVDLHYRHGWQHGTQRVGGRVTLTHPA